MCPFMIILREPIAKAPVLYIQKSLITGSPHGKQNIKKNYHLNRSISSLQLPDFELFTSKLRKFFFLNIESQKFVDYMSF